MKSRFLSTLVAGILALPVAAAVAAPPRHVEPPASGPVHPRSLEQAVKQVQRQTHGHILAADTVSRGRTQVYRIKVLTPRGKVQVMQLHSNPQPQSRSNHPESDQGGH